MEKSVRRGESPVMTGNKEKQAVLIVSKRLSKHIIRLYRQLHKATQSFADVFILLHTKPGQAAPEHDGVKIRSFTSNVLRELNYRPIRSSLLPGSNHFPLLEFYLQNPSYTHYWCIEDDVRFSGDWRHFFGKIAEGKNYDFIASHIRRYDQMPDWQWWDSLRTPGDDMESEELINSFNPVYRISHRGLTYIDERLKARCRGHHEVLLPSLLRKGGFSLADLGDVENGVTETLSLCTLRTMRFRPIYLAPGNEKNKLYHPVKKKITLKDVIVYMKRTVEKRKQYLS